MTVTIDAADAAEIAEALEFLLERLLESYDPNDLKELREDVLRIVHQLRTTKITP